MQYSLNKDFQHLKWQRLRSWISSPDFLVAMDKQQTQYLQRPKWKWKMLTNYWKFQNRSVQTFGFVYHDTNGQNHGPVWKTPVVPFAKNLYGHPSAGLLWERQFEKILLKHGWDKIPNSECLFVHREKGLFSSVYVDRLLFVGKNKILIRRGKYSTKKSIWENPHFSCSNLEFQRGEQKNYHSFKIFVFIHGLMTGLVMQRSVWNDIVSWQTRRLNNSTKYLLHASMTTIFKKKKKIFWRIVKYMLLNCSEMFIFGKNWTTWYFMVSK